MYLDPESRKQPLLEGGAPASETGGVDAPASEVRDQQNNRVYPKGPDREKLIQKTYGMFALQLLPQVILVALIVNSKMNCSAVDESGKIDFNLKCESMDGLIQFYTSKKLLWLSAILSIVATVIVVCKKANRDKLDSTLAYSCWVVQTISLCQVAGSIAAQCSDARVVVVAEIATLALAIIAFFCGGKLINYSANERLRSLGSMFLVLSFLLVLVLTISSIFGLGGTQSRAAMAVWIILAMAFFILDTQFIIGGYYVEITVDDHVFASMKLFADFILIFSLLAKCCN